MVDFTSGTIPETIIQEAYKTFIQNLSQLTDFTILGREEMMEAWGEDYKMQIYNCGYETGCLLRFVDRLDIDTLFLLRFTGSHGGWMFSTKMIIFRDIPSSCYLVKSSIDRRSVFINLVSRTARSLLKCATERLRIDTSLVYKPETRVSEFIKSTTPGLPPKVDPLPYKEILFAEGLGAFFDQRYDKAGAFFSGTLGEDPSDIHSHYFYGLSSFLSRKYNLAANELTMLLDSTNAPYELVDEARFYAGLSHFEVKEFNEAEGLFWETIEGAGDEELKCASLILLERIRGIARTSEYSLKRTTFNLNAGLGVQWDTNPKLLPEIYLEDIKGGPRGFLESSGDIEKSHPSHLIYGGRYRAYQNYHFGGDNQTNELNLSMVKPNVFAGYYLWAKKIPLLFILNVDSSYSLLKLKPYAFSYSLSPGIGATLNPHITLKCIYIYEKEDFMKYGGFSNTGHSFHVESILLLIRRIIAYRLRLGYIIENAENPQYTYNGYNFRMYLSSAFSLKTRGSIGMEYIQRDYPKNEASGRFDKGIEGFLTLEYLLKKNLLIGIGAGYEFRNSWNTKEKNTWRRLVISSMVRYNIL